jgi:hypothetical protein
VEPGRKRMKSRRFIEPFVDKKEEKNSSSIFRREIHAFMNPYTAVMLFYASKKEK